MSDLAPELTRRLLRHRVLALAIAFGLWAAGIEARLVYLQVFRQTELEARAERQQKRTIEVPAKRGEIRDRAGRVLAYSVGADSIYAVPGEIDSPEGTASTLCGALRTCTREFRKGLLERLRKPRAFVWVARKVSPDQARSVQALDLPGIGMLKESRRYYPNTTIGAHVVGYVGLDNTGLNGIELAYDRHIRGRPGTALVLTDARRHAFSRTERPPTTGSTVELTIDQVLQWTVERELKAAVRHHRAASGTVIVMDPWTGEVLAMANEPTFNPNDFGKSREQALRNRAIQDVYEPGSTFKVVTASAALEEKVVRPSDSVDVSQGYIRIGRRQIADVHRYGVLSFTDVIVKSSNVGAVKIGFKLGPDRLNRYVRRFGFGGTLSPDLRGEERGIVWSRLTDTALASVSMGYQIGVTPLQMATAVSSVANGGELIEPRLVRSIRGPDAEITSQKKVLRRTITPETAAELTSMMESVVERGTAMAAKIDGFTIAGKTGTSAKLVNGVYSKSDYMSSFVGFLPSRNPVVTILVVIDTPRGAYYGGVVAAPLFKRVAEIAMRHLSVPPTVNPAPAVLVKHEANEPAERPVSLPVGTPAVVPVHYGADQMPDLLGLSARNALSVLVRKGVTPRVHGSGVVVEQKPEPGTKLDETRRVELRLGRPPRAVPTQARHAGTGPAGSMRAAP